MRKNLRTANEVDIHEIKIPKTRFAYKMYDTVCNKERVYKSRPLETEFKNPMHILETNTFDSESSEDAEEISNTHIYRFGKKYEVRRT